MVVQIPKIFLWPHLDHRFMEKRPVYEIFGFINLKNK